MWSKTFFILAAVFTFIGGIFVGYPGLEDIFMKWAQRGGGNLRNCINLDTQLHERGHPGAKRRRNPLRNQQLSSLTSRIGGFR